MPVENPGGRLLFDGPTDGGAEKVLSGERARFGAEIKDAL
jgi:hypothetical protein